MGSQGQFRYIADGSVRPVQVLRGVSQEVQQSPLVGRLAKDHLVTGTMHGYMVHATRCPDSRLPTHSIAPTCNIWGRS